MNGDGFVTAAACFVFVALGVLVLVMAAGVCGCIDSPTFRNDRNLRIEVSE